LPVAAVPAPIGGLGEERNRASVDAVIDNICSALTKLPKETEGEEKVQEEVRNGIISVEKSKNDYGISIDPDTFEIDYKKTNKLRGRTR